MARLDSLPSLEIIQGYKGVIDYFVTRGIPCARRWPRYSRDRMSAPALAAAATFGLIIQAWALVCADLKNGFNLDAAEQPRTARDIYVQATYGYLHENKMSDILDVLNSIDAHLLTLEDLLDALASEATDQVRADVISSVLPTGAASQTTLTTLALESGGNLAAVKTALQIIDDFALATNKLFGYYDVYGETKTAGPVTGTQTLSGSVVPAGEVWVVTQVAAGHTDATARVTAIRGYIGGALISIASNRALAQYAVLDEQGSWVLKKDDYMEIVVEGLTAGSSLQCWFSGYKMKAA